MVNGNFSFGGLGVPIYNPASTRQLADGTWARDPFPNQQVPLSMFNPVSQAVLAIHPWAFPNTPGTYNSSGPSGNYAYSPPSRTYFDDLNGRVDHQFNPNIKAYASFTWNKSNGAGRPANMAVHAFDGTNGTESPQVNQSYSAGASWIISPTLFNDARFGYFRQYGRVVVASQGQDWGKI